MISLWLFVSLLTTALCRRHRNFVHISDGDDECSTPHNVEGECVPLRQCEPVMSLLRGGMSHQKMTYIRRSMCKFTGVVRVRHKLYQHYHNTRSGSTPDVCCPEEPVSLSWSGWAPWSSWSQCSARCGGGVTRRRRSCQGRDCRGASRDQRSQQRPCNEHMCGESQP